jgi:predicted MFS family arabinose efflux permease
MQRFVTSGQHVMMRRDVASHYGRSRLFDGTAAEVHGVVAVGRLDPSPVASGRVTRPAADRSVRTLVAGCLVGGVAGWSLTTAGAGATALETAYDVDLVMIGLLTTAMAVPYALLQLSAGSLVDRWGARAAGLLGLSVVVVAYLAALVAPDLWLALAARAVVGAGSALCFAVGADLARSSRTGPIGLGVFGGVAVAWAGAAVFCVPLAEGLLGWRSAWATAAAAAVVATAALVLVPVARSAAARPPMPSHGRASVLRDGEVHRLGAIHAVTLGLGVVLSNWVAVVLERAWGLSAGVAAGLGSLVLLLAMISRPLGGYLARRRPDRTRQMVVLSLLVSAAATAALARPAGIAAAAVATCALGMASGLPFAAVLATVQARRTDRPAAAVGLMNGQANALVVLGAPLLGAAIQGSRSTLGLLVVAAVWLVPLTALPVTLGRRGGRTR